jgi:hypothetical protein
MKARYALTGLAMVLGMALPAAADPAGSIQLAQAPTDATRPAPGPGARPHWGQRAEGQHGHHGWHRRAKAHRFSLSSLALRHQKDLALTPAQVDSLRKLGTDARRNAIKLRGTWRRSKPRCGRSRSYARMGAWRRSGVSSRAARCSRRSSVRSFGRS